MGTKIMLYLAVLALIVTAVGGFFAFHKAQLQSLQDKVDYQQAEIKGLNKKNAALEVSNASLKVKVERVNEDRATVYQELEKLRETDKKSQEVVAEFERKINDQKRNERLNAIRLGRKASLLLNIANKNVKCETLHMEDEGHCKVGRWYPAKKADSETSQ